MTAWLLKVGLLTVTLIFNKITLIKMIYMTDEIAQILLTAGAGTAGVLLTKAYSAYQQRTNKVGKVEALKQMYETLEQLYADDLVLQKDLNELARENETLKELIKNLKNEKK